MRDREVHRHVVAELEMQEGHVHHGAPVAAIDRVPPHQVQRAGDGFAIALGPDQPAVVAAAPPADRPWFDLGMDVWDARCASCHAELTYVPALFLAEGGRAYLAELLLFGIRGEVVIEGAPTNLRHRSYAALDDAQLAAVLNVMVVSWGNDEALPADVAFYEPDEIATGRASALSEAEVLERRPNPWR
jgi:mono/diheme cytochrome c family protein